MTKYFCNFCETGSIHCQVGCGSVTTIMEAKIRYPSPFHSPFKGFTNTYRFGACAVGKHKGCIEASPLGILCKYLQSIPGQWYCSTFAILGLVEGQRTALHIHT